VYTGAAAADTESLQFQLSNLTLLPGELLKPYWSRGISIRRQLIDLGVAVSDVTLLMWLLAGLPDEWKHFRSIAKYNTDANAGVFQMLRFLQQEEANVQKERKLPRATLHHTPHLPLAPPFVASTLRSFTGTCWKCNQPGHRGFECTNPANVCGHCGKSGHTKERCFHLHGFPPSSSSGPSFNAQRGRSRSRSPGRRPDTPAPQQVGAVRQG
jgi:hypothetical protein